MSSDQIRRLAGLSGLAGALLFFAGDMLFYGHLGPGAGFHEGMLATVKNASLARLFAGGLVGPLAACLCIVGFWHVYLNVRPSATLFARLMLVAFVVLMVFGSAIHTLWAAKGLALKYCPATMVWTAIRLVGRWCRPCTHIGILRTILAPYLATPGYSCWSGWSCWARHGIRGGQSSRTRGS